MTTDECPFCRQLASLDSLPSEDVVWTFPQSVALLGPYQYYHGYCILVSRTHARDLLDLDPGERTAYFQELCLLAQAVTEAFAPRKLNYELLGNQVPHPHWHLFPRYAHDPEHLQAVWLALKRGDHDPAEKERLRKGPMSREETRLCLRRALECLT